jgi:hypothetical protein
MARSTVFRFKGTQQDPRQIGRDLEVRAVLMDASHSMVTNWESKLTWSILQMAQSFGGAHYTRKLADITQVQSDITRDISSRLRIPLSGNEQRGLGQAGTSNPEAYRLYLEGRQAWYGRTPEGFKKSIDLFQQAIAADPSLRLPMPGS